MNYIISSLFLLFLSFQNLLAQNPIDYMAGHFKKIDISKYKGGELKLTVKAKAERFDGKAGASLFVRLDDDNDKVLLYDGPKETITENSWERYAVSCQINKKSKYLLLGVQCWFKGKFYFNDFMLEIKKKGGDWEKILIPNSDFKLNQKNHPSQKFSLPQNCTVSVHDDALIIDSSNIILHGHNDEVGKYMNIDQVKFYYEIYGKGFPLLLLHGNGQSIEDFAYQIPVLAKKFKVIAVDTRGHGRSNEDGSELSYSLFADDMLNFIDELKLDKVKVLGWSDGGNTALIMSIKSPDKIHQLAVMGACLYNDETTVKPEINSALHKRIKDLEKKNTEITFQQKLLHLLRDEPNINPIELKSIKCPALVMAGENDYFFESHTQLIAESIKHSKLIIFENGTHEEPKRNADRFNKAVLSFFEE
ncbi:alpha/beta fold hydrolase [Flammeovirga sp. SJP92]|uniref:alpha/beta fold hydrolase n=1 Tax=Flammeovirga sp. SJP92 TaxID=1775430 RepID=UPI000788037A|nr:alpha/beta hydrolase [Flammeovirga sp. SJP92]KXX67448.1 hypothetical protein AVL50_29520 [Flammeovirga sp. SJP92]